MGRSIRRRDSVLDCGDGVCGVTALASALRKRHAVRDTSWLFYAKAAIAQTRLHGRTPKAPKYLPEYSCGRML